MVTAIDPRTNISARARRALKIKTARTVKVRGRVAMTTICRPVLRPAVMIAILRLVRLRATHRHSN